MNVFLKGDSDYLNLRGEEKSKKEKEKTKIAYSQKEKKIRRKSRPSVPNLFALSPREEGGCEKKTTPPTIPPPKIVPIEHSFHHPRTRFEKVELPHVLPVGLRDRAITKA